MNVNCLVKGKHMINCELAHVFLPEYHQEQPVFDQKLTSEISKQETKHY